MKFENLLCAVIMILCVGVSTGAASSDNERFADMQLTQIVDGEEFVTTVTAKISGGNTMTLEMPGRKNIDVEYVRRTGGIIKFAVTEIEMGKVRTMHFVGNGFSDGKLTGKIVFIEDGILQENISGSFLLDDVFDW